MESDLAFAFQLADLADSITLSHWSSSGVGSTTKADGTPVTAADVAAERAILDAIQEDTPGDGFIGEEVGQRAGSTNRRWIVDGIDGTRSYAAGQATWGTLIALEVDDQVVLGVSSSPAQNRRWWASRGRGAFTGAGDGSDTTRLRVSSERRDGPPIITSLPGHLSLTMQQQHVLEAFAGGQPIECAWSHQNRVAEGKIDMCVWFAGDIWDHAAPSIIVEEAGGRFTDHWGGHRLDTRTAIYSNGVRHNDVVAALRGTHRENEQRRQ